jgi:hypothetical protein
MGAIVILDTGSRASDGELQVQRDDPRGRLRPLAFVPASAPMSPPRGGTRLVWASTAKSAGHETFAPQGRLQRVGC